jgi:hypothetical protein
MARLAEITPPSDVIVFNPLAWRRMSLVKSDSAQPMRDLETGNIIPAQKLPEGGGCFVADDLPSVGYRAYASVTTAVDAPGAVRMAGDAMENEFYRVTLDSKTGGIRSIYDKQLNRELVDSSSEFGLGELVYVTGGSGTSAILPDFGHLPPPTFDYHRQRGTGIAVVNGPVYGELKSSAVAEDFPGITMRVRLYHRLKQLDLVYELDKRETTDKEAVYLAFPFAFDAAKGGLWLEYPDQIIQPLADQNAFACRDWYAVQRWLAVSDGSDTVELSALDTPLFTLGHMTASTWPHKLSLERGHVFAYVMNNYWHTNYKAMQGGHFVFHYSLTSSVGAFSKRDAVTRGWNMYCPAVSGRGASQGESVIRPPSASLVRIEGLNVPLTTIKEAEDKNGFIFRLCDYSGAGGTANLVLPKAVRSAFLCNLVEMDPLQLSAQGSTVSVPVEPFAPLTLRMTFAH